jgi:hypothetical protein
VCSASRRSRRTWPRRSAEPYFTAK